MRLTRPTELAQTQTFARPRLMPHNADHESGFLCRALPNSVAARLLLSVAIPTQRTDDSSNRLLQLWPASGTRHIRPDSDLCLSLPCLPAPNWKCLWSPGSLRVNLSHDQRHEHGIRPRRRRRKPDHFPVLSRVRVNGVLHRRRPRRFNRSSDRRIRGPGISEPHVLGLRGAHAQLGVHASRHRAYGVGHRLCPGWMTRLSVSAQSPVYSTQSTCR